MVHRSQSTPPAAPGRPRALSRPIDVRNHLAQRRAVSEALGRVLVTGRRFKNGEMTARVFVAGDVYEVDARRLSLLQGGLTPADLELDPLPEA